MQDYTYVLTEPRGKRFDSEFKPQLTPAQMLQLGLFGAHYFENEQDEFPAHCFTDAKLSVVHNPSLNYFKIDADPGPNGNAKVG